MPQRGLSPEEFDVVYRRAIKQAPADLSQAEFDDYVAQQAQHEEAAKAGSVAPQAAGGLSFSPAGILGGFFNGAKGLAGGIVNAVEHPWTTAKGVIDNQVGQFGKAYDDYQKGHYSEMAGHTAAGALPLIGPAAADIGERTAETGDIGNAIGEASLLSLLSSPSAVKPALTTASRIVPATGRGIAAVGRGMEYVGKKGGTLPTNPIKLLMKAGPKLTEWTGQGAQRVGNSMASLTGSPSEWITSTPSAPSHADLNAWGAKQYSAKRAQQQAAEKASDVTMADLMNERSGPADYSADTDLIGHGGVADRLAPTLGAETTGTTPRYNVSEQDALRNVMASTEARMTKAKLKQPTFNQKSPQQTLNEEAIAARRARTAATADASSPSMDSLMDLPGFAALPDEADMAMALGGRKQTGRW